MDLLKIAGAFAPIIVGIYFLDPATRSNPSFDESFVYQAARGYLDSQYFIRDAAIIKMSSNMVEHAGEALLSGTGFTFSRKEVEFDLPMYERVDLFYLAVISRECMMQSISCYQVKQMSMTANSSILPQL